MKKILLTIKVIIGDFFINPFWKSWLVLVILFCSLLLNALLWYFFAVRIKGNSLPFLFASGLILLNLILGNYLFNREKLASYILISIGFFTQILMLIFIRYLVMVF